ncbi:MAG TPA: hypothetical protein VFF73_12415 [Planctomycetota bacterium]|nr:hypothetical protein [Planctomycetota bacterium]
MPARLPHDDLHVALIMRRPVLALVALGVAACGHGGGGGGAVASLVAPVATPSSSSTTAPVPSASSVPPLVVPAASQAELDQVFADTWTALMPTVRGALDAEVQKLVGTMVGPVRIDSLSIASLDIASAPRIAISPVGSSATQVEILFPRGTWALGLAGHVEYSLSILTLSADVTVDLTNVQATETVVIDTSDPTLPVVAQAGRIQTSYDLALSTTNTALAALLPSLQPMLQSAVDQTIQKALAPYDAIFASLVGQPNAATIWGLGAPARPAFPLQPNLENAALAVSQDIQSVNTPYGGVVTAYMSDPTPGVGTPLHWEGYGDSAIWTGHYLAAESFRYAVTKDPAAQANASLALAAIQDMLDAETPGGGHLCRCVVPASAPDAATLLQQANAFTSTVRGQSVVCLGDVTRDQYLGVMHGLGCAYDLLDDPATKQLAGSLVERIVDYLVANGWIAMKHDNATASALFCVSPEKMVAFTALAAHVDAARYQALRDQVGQLAWVVWVFDVPGTIDPLESYYKWNLEEGAIYHALRLETDPGRQAALVAAHAIERRVIGHHENAYFQAIDAALDPTLATALGPMILDELRRFVARGGMNGLDRRDFTVTNSTDPTIAQGTYTSLVGTSTTTIGQGATTSTEALYPIAVEKRPSTDFLWQRDPFALDGAGDPQRQAPGVDLVLPYWMARFHGLIH